MKFMNSLKITLPQAIKTAGNKYVHEWALNTEQGKNKFFETLKDVFPSLVHHLSDPEAFNAFYAEVNEGIEYLRKTYTWNTSGHNSIDFSYSLRIQEYPGPSYRFSKSYYVTVMFAFASEPKELFDIREPEYTFSFLCSAAEPKEPPCLEVNEQATKSNNSALDHVQAVADLFKPKE